MIERPREEATESGGREGREGEAKLPAVDGALGQLVISGDRPTRGP